MIDRLSSYMSRLMDSMSVCITNDHQAAIVEGKSYKEGTHKVFKEVKLENDAGIGPAKEFPWNLLQTYYYLADNR